MTETAPEAKTTGKTAVAAMAILAGALGAAAVGVNPDVLSGVDWPMLAAMAVPGAMGFVLPQMLEKAKAKMVAEAELAGV